MQILSELPDELKSKYPRHPFAVELAEKHARFYRSGCNHSTEETFYFHFNTLFFVIR